MKKIVLITILCPLIVFAQEWIKDSRTGCEVWNPRAAKSERIEWSGACINGKASGYGVLQWYLDNKPNGYNQGDYAEGQIKKGLVIYPSGNRYFGEFVDGKSEGKGISIALDGKLYEGDFKNNKPDGKGTFYLLDGSRYVGAFKQGLFDGAGALNFPDGTSSEVNFKGGKSTPMEQLKD